MENHLIYIYIYIHTHICKICLYKLVKTFKNNRLSITLKTNLKAAHFLDIHFDLVKEIYQPYKKLNDDPLYINKKCNHPPSILQ